MSLRITELRQLLELAIPYLADGALEVAFASVTAGADEFGAPRELSVASALDVIYTLVRDHEKDAIRRTQAALAISDPPAHGLG